MGLHDEFKQGRYLPRLADIGGEVVPANLYRHLFRGISVPRKHYDLGSFARKCTRDSKADVVSRTRDQCDFASEQHNRLPPRDGYRATVAHGLTLINHLLSSGDLLYNLVANKPNFPVGVKATMIRAFQAGFVLSFLAVSACVSQTVKLVHPQSGASAKCDASGFGYMSVAVESAVKECVRRIEKDGYVPIEKLTPEQRADLERRGLWPKN
jgi:hypothetical protein